MNRTIFSVVGRDRTFLMLDAAAADVPMDNLTEVNLAVLPATGTLAERGEALLAVLKTDGASRQVLDALLKNGLNADPAPIYFHVRASAADPVTWEQLHSDTAFVALDRRWPIGRICRQKLDVEMRGFTPPLRIVAVLAAAGRSGLSQLKALSEACANVALPTRLHVISADTEVQKAAANLNATFEQIGTSGPALMAQVRAAKPQLVHLLCHGGGTAAGLRLLAFADANDVDAAQLDPTVMGSIRVSTAQLVQALVPCNPWLVVLGACESARADDAGTDNAAAETLALAHELASGGVPGVIGMRRLVDISATDTFCREFYPEALALIEKTVAPGAGPARELDWAEALTRPRVVLGDPDPATVDVWTDPVLYAQHGALRILVTPGPLSARQPAAIVGKIDRLQGGLSTLIATNGSPAAIADIAQRIAELQAQLGQGRP